MRYISLCLVLVSLAFGLQVRQSEGQTVSKCGKSSLLRVADRAERRPRLGYSDAFFPPAKGGGF